MSFIKNKYELYDDIHETYFMFNNFDKCDDNNLYNITKSCSDILFYLRTIECQYYSYYQKNGKIKTIDYLIKNINLKKDLDLIRKCYNFLANSNYSWLSSTNYTLIYELHDRLNFYYRIMNEKIIFKNNNIKIINVNKHNHCVHYIFKHFNTDTLPSMIFFDSHPDMNYPTGNYINNYDNDNNCLGSVNIPLLLEYKNNNGINLIVPDDHPYSYTKTKMYMNNKYIFSKKDDTQFLKQTTDKNGNISINYIIKYSQHNDNNTSILKTFDYTITNIEYFKFYENITQQYILNIDLDYFISQGNTTSDDYNSNFNSNTDIISSELQNIYFEAQEDEHIQKLISIEITYIRNKINKFLLFINNIKQYGKIPKMIIICDSSATSISLFGNHTGIGENSVKQNGYCNNLMSNRFLPKRYSFWLRNTLIHNIKIILSEDFQILD